MKEPNVRPSSFATDRNRVPATDVMVSGPLPAGLVRFRGSYVFVEDVVAKAKSLQDDALVARKEGRYEDAVALYRQLIPYLVKLDELDTHPFPKGLQVQIAERTIEQLESSAVHVVQ